MASKILKLIFIILTITYVVSPVDLIPDPTPIVGYLDDIMAIYLCYKNIMDKKNLR